MVGEKKIHQSFENLIRPAGKDCNRNKTKYLGNRLETHRAERIV